MPALAERVNVLLAGSGGREHATAVELARSPYVGKLFIAPGNAGTAEIGTNLPVAANDIDGLVRAARDNNVGLFTAGSENTFVLGAVDAMREAGIEAYGVDQDQARLETDKIFSHKMMIECGIPCPRGVAAENYDEALAFLDNPPWEKFVVKAAGPAGGKGVELPEDIEEARRIVREFMLDLKHGEAGKRILFQERLYGHETSLIATVSGKKIVGEPMTTDYKLKLTGNKGPNTGGMGCIIDINSQPPRDWLDRFIRPIAEYYVGNDNPLNTKIYAQLIHTADGIKVLEYNMRDGNPEAQAKLRLKSPKSDLFRVMKNSLNGNLLSTDLEFDYDKAASCLVVASEGYPEKPVTGDRIVGLGSRLEEGVVLYHAGTKIEGEHVLTNGGRVLNITATGRSLPEAVSKMYKEADKRELTFRGAWYRDDIGEIYGSS